MNKNKINDTIKKIIRVNYSSRRQEIYINDFNDNIIFNIQLYEVLENRNNDFNNINNQLSFDDFKNDYITDNDIDIDKLLKLENDTIINIFNERYFERVEISENLDIIGTCNDSVYDNQKLFKIGLSDYTVYYIFAEDSESALLNLDAHLESNENEYYYNNIVAENEENKVYYMTIFEIE